MKILVAGGAGYIGSHTMVELLAQNYEVVCVDNFYNSCMTAVDRVEEIAGKKVKFYEQDLCDRQKTLEIFQKERVDAVIHFAGYKAVGESVQMPLEYYSNNINSTISIVQAMRACGVRNLVFSSSATVYGNPHAVPIKEDFPTGGITNPYGATKLFIEQILKDVALIEKDMNIALLRYFNPIGAHPSGKIGEDPNGIPNNLVPYIAQVSVGKLPFLKVYGNDYPTRDGTGVRDYIHVVDLARGHLAALKKLAQNCGLFICNLGTGNGYSVMEVLHAYEKAAGKQIPYKVVQRRAGDIAECYADPTFAFEQMGWKANLGIEEMCRDSFRFQQQNINGYKG